MCQRVFNGKLLSRRTRRAQATAAPIFPFQPVLRQRIGLLAAFVARMPLRRIETRDALGASAATTFSLHADCAVVESYPGTTRRSGGGSLFERRRNDARRGGAGVVAEELALGLGLLAEAVELDEADRGGVVELVAGFVSGEGF